MATDVIAVLDLQAQIARQAIQLAITSHAEMGVHVTQLEMAIPVLVRRDMVEMIVSLPYVEFHQVSARIHGGQVKMINRVFPQL